MNDVSIQSTVYPKKHIKQSLDEQIKKKTCTMLFVNGLKVNVKTYLHQVIIYQIF